MPELKLYTVADLREWLVHNHAAEGLSERIIAPPRAWAIIHNPYVQNEDPVLSAIFEDGLMVAFTAAFPEMIENNRYWWFTSLWCDPRYQGRGFGLIVIGSLVEVYGKEYIFDRWGAKETVEIFAHLGTQIIYTPRYILGSKINRHTTKGKLLHIGRSLQKNLFRLVKAKIITENYYLRYLTSIDDETYTFIQSHRNNDLFLRSQSMLNWIFQYSFTQSSPLIERTMPTTPFAPARAQSNQLYAVQVCDENRLIGFYMMKYTDQNLHILYLYYQDSAYDKVFASVRDHIMRLNISQFVTDNEELASYIRKMVYFPKYNTQQIHLAYPTSFCVSSVATFQYGDGDNFTAE